MMNNILYVKEVAQVLAVHENTVRNLANSGKLPTCRDYRNRRVFKLRDILRVKNEREQLRAAK